jgi:hypothetical protein
VRWLSLAAWCLLLASLGITQERALVPATPDGHVRLAAAYLARVPVDDQPYAWFFSWLGTDQKALVGRQQTLSMWLASMSREPDLEFPKEVPGSDGLLWMVDIRDFGWNSSARHAVALRETYFREPWVSAEAANALRSLIYATQDPKTLHAEGVVRADWLFRETAETDRSQAYYDLLFARERFGDSEYLKGNERQGAGWYYRGANKGGLVDANFPRDEKDWEKTFGADVILDLLKKQRLRVEHGAIVEEGVSIVARQNRLLWRTPIVTGAYWKTFDVLKTADGKDYTESLIFDVKFDAGELIANLPNGAQAYLLIDGKGKRIEAADGKAAIDSTDAKDRRVRNPGSCVCCHGQGVNRPENLVEQFLQDGLDIKFRENRKAREVRSFFLNWDRKLKSDQDGYQEFVKRTCGRTGEANASEFKKFRDAYDAPIDLKQACAETGMTEAQFKEYGNRSPHARPLMLIRGRTVPRSVWEQDTFREMMLLSIARK